MTTMRDLRECVTDLADWFSDNPNTDDIETALHDLINRVEVAALKEAIKQQCDPIGELSVWYNGHSIQLFDEESIPVGHHNLYTSAPSIPEGWQQVNTLTVTADMVRAGRDVWNEDEAFMMNIKNVFKAMLAAAYKGEQP